MKRCRECNNILEKHLDENGYVYTCLNCKTRYTPIESNLLPLRYDEDRFHMVEYDTEFDTWAIDDILTDGRYSHRRSGKSVADLLNKMDKEILDLRKENYQLRKTQRIDLKSIMENLGYELSEKDTYAYPYFTYKPRTLLKKRKE